MADFDDDMSERSPVDGELLTMCCYAAAYVMSMVAAWLVTRYVVGNGPRVIHDETDGAELSKFGVVVDRVSGWQ